MPHPPAAAIFLRPEYTRPIKPGNATEHGQISFETYLITIYLHFNRLKLDLLMEQLLL